MRPMADKKRRKSLRIFKPRPDTPPESPFLPSGASSPVEKRSDPFAGVSPDDSEASSPKIRPRTLQKTNRTSVFGSLRSLHYLDEDEKANLTRSDSKASSLHEDGISIKGLFGEGVLRHGEVLPGGNTMFRKKYNYLVLTESHLIRFKTQAKAGEVFPNLVPITGRPPVPRGSMSSIGSFTDMQSNMHNDITQGIALDQIVAIYKLEDGRPFFTVEISYLDEAAKRSSAMQLHFHEPRDMEAWTASIRDASIKARARQDRQFRAQTLEYIARVLERERDYDPLHFRTFKVVQLGTSRNNGRSSSEDLSKSASSVCYLAIGINKVHLIPLPRWSNRSSSTSLVDIDTPTSFGIVNLVSVFLPGDDLLQANFRSPFRHPHQAALASCQATDIALWLRYAAEYVRPEWTVQPFVFEVPAGLDDQLDPPNFPAEDHNCFDRTLIAYCAAYNLDTQRIVYGIDYETEDAPCFRLMPPASSQKYSALELLAVLRSLRYNESINSISFANIDLRALRDTYDPFAQDIDSRLSRSGQPIHIPGHDTLPVLVQEIRALAIKSRRLRRLDFTNAMSRPQDCSEERQSCGIPEALAPLCKKNLTNIDWVILSGILLGDSDLDFLVDTASDRRSHLRALEIGDCGLTVHDIDVLLSTLAVHDNTMEVINLSGAQGRFSPELFQRGIGAFSHIRRLNVTRVQKTAGPEPLIAPEILLGWRLEVLNLSQTTLNEQSVDGISAYLASSKSDSLRELHLNQCGLTGKDLAVFLQAMSRKQGEARNMHVNASENRLSTGFSSLARSIAANFGPASLSMRMIDFEKEHQFRELVDALTKNTTLRSLDISRASLPYDAGDDTCEALKVMFASNQSLEELDISGEHAHLDATRFGIGLNIALRGLEHNRSLKLLRIEHQCLGLQGANTLAGVLETNRSLIEIHCEHNDINLQSFTVLVNALKRNKTLLYLPALEQDKAKSMDKVKEEFEHMDKVQESKAKSSPKAANTLKKGVSVFAHKASRNTHHRHSSSTTSNISFTEQDMIAAMHALEEKWQHQVARMQRYLSRNYHLCSGVVWNDDEEKDHDPLDGPDGRPITAESLGKVLAKVKVDRTPTVEKPFLLEPGDEKKIERKPLVFRIPE